MLQVLIYIVLLHSPLGEPSHTLSPLTRHTRFSVLYHSLLLLLPLQQRFYSHPL